MVDCLVCCVAVSGRNKLVRCNHCNYGGCRSCNRRFILDSVNEAKCMNCKGEWSRTFLHDNFPQSFLNKDYKKKREDVLFNVQKSMMQDTQLIVTVRLQRNQINKEIAKNNKLIRELKERNNELSREKYELSRGKEFGKKKTSEKFFGHCPIGDCRGFIASSWKCGVCDTKVCKSCKEIPNDDHICNENTILAIKAIKKDCKPCPECRVPIMKISGCYAMWCTECHVSFDWGTGERIRGNVHNPHQAEWLRTHPRSNPIPVGGVCGRVSLRFLNGLSKVDNVYFLQRFDTFLNHCDAIERRRFNTQNNNFEDGNYLELRVKYLTNKITEQQFRTSLQREQKMRDKKHDYYLILSMFIDSSRDILNTNFRNITIRTITGELLIETVETLRELIKYTNISFENSAKIYKNKKLTIIKYMATYGVVAKRIPLSDDTQSYTSFILD